MAIFVSIDIPGVTKEQFEGMGNVLLPLIRNRAGFISHGGWQDDSGAHIREIWGSRGDYDGWIQDEVAPRMSGATPPPPQINELQDVCARSA